MSATQGVILIMMGALALYLMWNSKSPFNSGKPTTPTTLPSTPGSAGKSGFDPGVGAGSGGGGGGGGSWDGHTPTINGSW